MDIKIVNQDAEQHLLRLAEESHDLSEPGAVLHLQFSQLTPTPGEEEVVRSITPLLADMPSALYLLEGGDMVIGWTGAQKVTHGLLCSRLYESLGLSEQNLHTYYDLRTDGEDLKRLCLRSMGKLSGGAGVAPAAFTFTLTAEQNRVFHEAVQMRNYRDRPEILIVEDQLFSSNLLIGILTPAYQVYVAPNAMMAWDLYLEHAPGIVLLDIELPEIDGHRLAGEICKLDPQAFIVMVTGNHYEKDVMRALEAGARGFIVKPFSKQKIMANIQKYMQERKSRKTG